MRQSLLSFVSKNTLVCVQNESIVTAELDALLTFAHKAFENLSGEIKRQPPKELFIDGKQFAKELKVLPNVRFSTSKKTATLHFSCQPQPHFKRKFDWFAEHLTENTEKQRTNHIFLRF